LYEDVLQKNTKDGNFTVKGLGCLSEHPFAEYEIVVHPQNQLAGPLGVHLVDVGFLWYQQRIEPSLTEHQDPEAAKLMPAYKPEGSEKTKDIVLPEKYAILCAGYTSENRKPTGKWLVEMCTYLESMGIATVFLGSSKPMNIQGNYTADFLVEEMEYCVKNLSAINLVGKTDLVDAVTIISGSQMVVGLDNGLLHLASLTDVPIIFGYTIQDIEMREPRRRGNTFLANIFIKKETLSCIGCQKNVRYRDYDSRFCPYSDNKCCEILCGSAEVWKEAVQHADNWNKKNRQTNGLVEWGARVLDLGI